ncbi:MAG: apolipoprotein N-acyltransferase [Phycisphaeraceae bacterium]|nr:apolipoprotein N-acyltransferase [Phycisphaeraceae bacterium]
MKSQVHGLWSQWKAVAPEARTHVAMLLASALMLGLAYPQPGWWVLAHVALAPMTLLALRSASWRILAATGWLVGWFWWLVMMRWLMAVTVGGHIALSAYLALYWPAYLVMVRMLGRRWKLPMVTAVPMAWVSLEFLRGNIVAGGFGWFALSHAMANDGPSAHSPWMAQLADLGGEWTVSLLVAMSSGMVVDLLTLPWKRNPLRKWLPSPAACCYIVWMAAMLGTWCYAWVRITHVPSGEPTLRVAVVQTDVPQSNRNYPTDEQVAEDWRKLKAMTIEAATQPKPPDLIVWPETVVPAALNPEAVTYYRTAPTGERGLEMYHDQVRELAAGIRIPLLVGADAKFDWRDVRGPRGERWLMSTRRCNAAYLVPPDLAQPLQRYDKVHRVPFGEYIPWVSSWPWLKALFLKYLSPYDFDYSVQPGQRWVTMRMEAKGRPWSLATPICFEDAVPRVVRAMQRSAFAVGDVPQGDHQTSDNFRGNFRGGLDVLVNVTNDGWYAGQWQGPQHVQIASLRCVENRLPMVRAVNTGISGWIDGTGRIRGLVEHEGRRQNVEGWATWDVTMDGRWTLFDQVGQWPMALLTAATVFLSILGGRWADKRSYSGRENGITSTRSPRGTR